MPQAAHLPPGFISGASFSAEDLSRPPSDTPEKSPTASLPTLKFLSSLPIHLSHVTPPSPTLIPHCQKWVSLPGAGPSPCCPCSPSLLPHPQAASAWAFPFPSLPWSVNTTHSYVKKKKKKILKQKEREREKREKERRERKREERGIQKTEAERWE